MQSFSFQSHNLVVDYISFKFQEFHDITKKQIASYLCKIGFNVSQQSGKLAKPFQEFISFNQENKYQALFVNEAPYWCGTVLHFQGKNAAIFYRLAQQGFIDWTLFSSASLGRFDLYYNRDNQKQDKLSNTQFLQNCFSQLNSRNTNVSLEKNSKGFILKIGKKINKN